MTTNPGYIKINANTVTTEEEYDALPEGSVVAKPEDFVLQKGTFGTWCETFDDKRFTSAEISGTTRTVLRYGWSDEQPAWRIEHNLDSIRVGEYIIDCEDDDGTVTHKWREHWVTDGDAYGARCFAPFIVFSDKDAATTEAVKEAKRALDKEMGK